MALIVLILSGILIYNCRKSTLFTIMSVFMGYANYSVVMGIYLFPELRPKTLYSQITNVKVYGIGIFLLLLFMVSVLFFFPFKKIDEKDITIAASFIKKEKFNTVLFFVLLTCFCFICIFGYSRAVSARGSSSPVYEYNTILLLSMFYYSGDKKITRYLCYLCAAVYVLTSLFNGTRVEAVICIFIVYLCSIKKKLPVLFIISGLISGIILMNFIGIFRGNYGSIVDGFRTSIQHLWKSKLVFNTCTHAYFPSLCMIEVFQNYSFHDAVYFGSRFLSTIIMGQSRITDGDLISYVGRTYYHNNGGWSLGFFYVWFSYLGALLYGILLRIYARLSTIKTTPFYQCLAIYFVATIPRWYLYGPWSCTRGILICSIIFGFFNQIDNLSRKKGKLLI
ncbi:MAG: hypothetical protein HFG28_12400 [Eubacterium sp.]|nr:hypothetical protein [Eubacterium sp.]